MTFLIAIYATFFGTLFAVLGAFVAARPLSPALWACWAMRRGLARLGNVFGMMMPPSSGGQA